MKSERKWYRMWRVLSFALSLFIQVYWYKMRKKPAADWEQLWEKLGRQFRELLFELQGLLIKIGQMLSIRADLLPNHFVKQIEDLVDQVPPSPWDDIKSVLEREWDGQIEEKLLSIEPNAVASASIGEVYRGVLKDGTEVAVKVQRPTIQKIVQTDFRTLSIIIWFANYFAPIPKGFIHFKLLFQELKQVIERELDYKKEMETAQHFQQRFQGFSKLKIPTIYEELCTSQVLVMEWVEGFRITDVEALDRFEIDRVELAQRLVRIFLPQWLEAGMFHADPHSGNVLVKEDGTLVLLDFGMVGEISKTDASNFQGLLEAILLKNYAKSAEGLLNLGFLLPGANLKIIEKLLADVISFDLTQLKELDLIKMKKEMTDLVHSLPIQVPTRFVFLGRSFATIEGLFFTLCPEKEPLEIIKPAFFNWLEQSETSKWKLFFKWVHSLPVFQIIHSVTDLINKPQEFLEQKELQQQRDFQFMIFENQKKRIFFLGLLGVAGALFGLYEQATIIWQCSFGVIGVSLLSYGISSRKQKKWLKSIHK
ncbi:AarF/ABC1/UbiB kinase family protein [Bacillus sp. Bva_UNVM-123]|uniref:ABC1 kinase family protein n=1 Tax=Bacillus sp. Bva_UNVM-123 TaxID=2829798 RepID=UPI00391EFBCA